MNSCPANPGSTVIIRTMSTIGNIGSIDAMPVFGFIDTPTFFLK